MTTTRRDALRSFAVFLAGSSALAAQSGIAATVESFAPISGRPATLESMLNVFEFERACQQHVSRSVFDNVAAGANGEWSVRHNREAFERIVLRPRVLVDTSRMDLSLALFGDRLDFPILIAPTAGHGALHPDGELATARAAAKLKTVMALSTASSHPLDKVAQAADSPKWFQLYPGPDLEATWDRVDRARTAGFRTIVLTVNGPYNAHRERVLLGRLPSTRQAPRRRASADPEPPPHPYGLGRTLVHQLDWSFVDRLKDRAKLPLLIKGIQTAEDGALAVEHGADGIIVSNHGGRYLEYGIATIEALPEVIAAVQGKIPVLVDSGFRRGTDVLKALAIEAKAVLIGRPPLWGLGAFGEAGVARVLELLRTELALAMGLCGKATLESIDKSLLMRADVSRF